MLAQFAAGGSALICLMALAAPSPVHAGQIKHETPGENWLVTNDDEARFAYVLVRKKLAEDRNSGESRTESHTTGSGESDDFREAREIRERLGKDVLWARFEGRRYVIRDRATMNELEETLLPQQLLGRQQGLLGKQQGRLGQKQGQLGRQQGELGARQGRLGARQARLSAEMARLQAAGLSTESVERELGAVSREQEEVGLRQTELGEAQQQLGREQAELGQRQSELGVQQGELTRELNHQIERLIKNAIARGLAEPIG